MPESKRTILAINADLCIEACSRQTTVPYGTPRPDVRSRSFAMLREIAATSRPCCFLQYRPIVTWTSTCCHPHRRGCDSFSRPARLPVAVWIWLCQQSLGGSGGVSSALRSFPGYSRGWLSERSGGSPAGRRQRGGSSARCRRARTCARSGAELGRNAVDRLCVLTPAEVGA